MLAAADEQGLEYRMGDFDLKLVMGNVSSI